MNRVPIFYYKDIILPWKSFEWIDGVLFIEYEPLDIGKFKEVDYDRNK